MTWLIVAVVAVAAIAFLVWAFWKAPVVDEFTGEITRDDF